MDAPVSRPGLFGLLAILAAASWYGPLFREDASSLVDNWTEVPIADDGFYYLQVARHIAAGHGSTFDGVHATNGHQPLWTASLVALQALGRFSPDGLFYAAVALSLVLLMLTAWQTHGLLRDVGFSEDLSLVLACTTLFSPLISQMYLSLCEAPVNGLLFVGALRLVPRVLARSIDDRGHLLVGLVLGLLFVARTDNVFMIAAWSLAMAVALGPRAARSLALVAAPIATLSLAYVAYNVIGYGHPVPISGRVKTHWSGPVALGDAAWRTARLERLFWFLSPEHLHGDDPRGFPRALAATWLSVPFAAFALRRFRGLGLREAHTLVLALAFVSFVLEAAYYAAFQGSQNDAPWYFVHESLALWLALGFALAHAERTRRPAAWAASCVLAGVILWANAGNVPAVPWRAPTAVIGLAAAGALGTAVVAMLLVARTRVAVALVGASLMLFFLTTNAQLRLDRLARPGNTEKASLVALGRFLHELRLSDYGTVGAYSAGLIGYFEGGHVTNLDGLIADPEWFELARRAGSVPPPRRETFVVDYWPGFPERLREAGYVTTMEALPPVWGGGVQVWARVWIMTLAPDAALRALTALARRETAPAAAREEATRLLEQLTASDSTSAAARPDAAEVPREAE